MKLFSKLFVACLLSLLFCTTATAVFADAQSDYQYQYGQYRQNYIEYTILKKDFLGSPTLDNQQKAILAAKQTIISRDQAKASFADYLLSLCQENQTNYAPIKPILDSLNAAKIFYLSEVNKAQAIVTPAQLASFTTDYVTNTVIQDRSFRTGVIACKISELVRIQIGSKNALDVIIPKLAVPFSTPLQTRITDLQSQGNDINDAINTLTASLFSEAQMDNIDNSSYFSNSSDKIKKIQSLQLKWINGLIDIDINYAHS